MLSIDMVGWYKASGYLKYSGSGTIKNGKQLILDSRFIPEGLHVEIQDFERRSGTDTHGFAMKGIPTLHVTTGMKSPYHKPEDDAELIDYEGMTLVVKHLTNLIRAISTDEDFRSSGKIAATHKPPSRVYFGISANLGSNYHHYTAGALNGKSAGAYGAGLMAGINMGALAIRPEVYYDFIQARHPAGNISTHGVTVPLNLLLQTPSSSSAGAAIFAGPYYSYKFSGKQGSAPIDFENLFQREEIGINWGVELRVSPIRLIFSNRSALTNFTRTKNDDGAHIRNRTFYMTVSYVF